MQETRSQTFIGPRDLIDRFCDEHAVGALADPIVQGEREVTRGFCGYEGCEGDGISVGFDDGYDFLEFLGGRGWLPLDDKGQWPYTIYLIPVDATCLALVEYCEGDLTISEFKSARDRRDFCRGIA
jgi:hypothetical protein